MLGHRLGFSRPRILGAALTGLLALAAGLTGSPAPAAADTGLQVYVGYADNLRANPAGFPTPWAGSPNTIFVGTGPDWDAGAIRVDNTSASAISGVHIVLNLHPAHGGPVFDLWGAHNLAPGQSLIVTQTGFYNFDTSDYGFNPCGVWAGPNEDPPVFTVDYTMSDGSHTSSSFVDHGHILDTGAYDLVCQRNESIPWALVGNAPVTEAHLTLAPPSQNATVGNAATVTAAFMAGSTPLTNTTVNFLVVSGPNAGLTATGVTDATGHAAFSYPSAAVGTDTIRATVTNPGGTIGSDNAVTVNWQPAVCTSPPTLGMISPVTGSSYGTGDTVPIRFAYTDCHGAMVRDESVIVEVYDTANMMYPVTTWVYGYDVVIDPSGVYSVDFQPGMYGVAAGSHLQVNVWFDGALAGQAWFDVH